MGPAADFLQFCEDTRVTLFERQEFSLLLTSPDEPHLWSAHESKDGGMLAALCGRIALDQWEWDEAEQEQGTGGLACKSICRKYREGGLDRVAGLNGNYVILLLDRIRKKFILITDRMGLCPAFQWERQGAPVFSSHPDALADAVSESGNYDLTSLAEFVLTARVSHPFTYYERIRALPAAAAVTVNLEGDQAVVDSTRNHCEFHFAPQPEERLDDLARELADGFTRAIAKRTLPLLGRSAIALSGGLDSRVLVSVAPQSDELIAFTCYDRENTEFRTARAVAKAARAKFVPLRRGPDYYAENAMLGARISGGMGCIASNHFLGFRRELRDLGINNLLTGCYCDYLFKGLGLNKRVNRWTTRESLGRFDFSYYAGHAHANTELGRRVTQRLEAQFPPQLRNGNDEGCVAEIHRRRLFPLCYEEDNAERTIPQRVMGWYVPIAENDLLDVFLRMSSSMKLNRRLFLRMVEQACPSAMTRISDANTGAPVQAGRVQSAVSAQATHLKSVLRGLLGSPTTNGSWPDWRFYVNHSPIIQSLWEAPNAEADELFTGILGREGCRREIGSYRGGQLWVFMQMLTLKLWLDQRR